MSTANISIMQRIKDYLSLIKFSHTVFALPFALIGFALAVIYEQYTFQWHLLIMMLMCMVFARRFNSDLYTGFGNGVRHGVLQE